MIVTCESELAREEAIKAARRTPRVSAIAFASKLAPTLPHTLC
ncbi:hypothetical protein KPSA3_01465 [Pseudomonas syringae pv. actinidiae]|uniref:Uncharacterized protein n=1 Tax=Pseudomonas syringae pv. actinidiae TaxID=103796 RepID=A0AAN4Q1M1_PSESF|nr:hypothetical protein KPSA3_01465 [Pseudomonas syringae pv. actinidiae]